MSTPEGSLPSTDYLGRYTVASMDSGETSDPGAEIERRDSLSKLEEPVAF